MALPTRLEKCTDSYPLRNGGCPASRRRGRIVWQVSASRLIDYDSCPDTLLSIHLVGASSCLGRVLPYLNELPILGGDMGYGPSKRTAARRKAARAGYSPGSSTEQSNCDPSEVHPGLSGDSLPFLRLAPRRSESSPGAPDTIRLHLDGDYFGYWIELPAVLPPADEARLLAAIRAPMVPTVHGPTRAAWALAEILAVLQAHLSAWSVRTPEGSPIPITDEALRLHIPRDLVYSIALRWTGVHYGAATSARDLPVLLAPPWRARRRSRRYSWLERLALRLLRMTGSATHAAAQAGSLSSSADASPSEASTPAQAERGQPSEPHAAAD